MRAALNCLHSLRPANRAFAQDRILELAFSPLLTTTYAPLFESVRSHSCARRASRSRRRCASAPRRASSSTRH